MYIYLIQYSNNPEGMGMKFPKAIRDIENITNNTNYISITTNNYILSLGMQSLYLILKLRYTICIFANSRHSFE